MRANRVRTNEAAASLTCSTSKPYAEQAIALKYYEKAAAQGHIEAKVVLAKMAASAK